MVATAIASAAGDLLEKSDPMLDKPKMIIHTTPTFRTEHLLLHFVRRGEADFSTRWQSEGVSFTAIAKLD